MSTRSRIEELLRRGLSLSEIARQLRVAHSTVAYHVARRAEPNRLVAEAASQPAATVRGRACAAVRTREQVAELLARGSTKGDIARRLGLSKSTVSYHARRLGEPVDARGARRYDWGLIQAHYDLGHSVRACQAQFGFSRQTWNAAVKRGAVVPRPHRLPLDELLVAGVHRGRYNVKVRLIGAGLKESRCELCGISDWRGLPITLALHHVNGRRDDNRLENLQLLCPNCHSQTDTFAGRNPHLADEPAPA